MIGVILAAGMGTRLMPLTKDIPKALLKINGMTLVERMIKNCIDAGISKFIVVVGYNKDKVIDLCPELSREELNDKFISDFQRKGKTMLKNYLKLYLTNSFIDYFLKECNVDGKTKLSNIDKKSKNRLIENLKRFSFEITDFNKDLSKVTIGGIDLDNINSKTMESTLIPNLYFAGEILDLHGPTGGYNLKIAFSTGYLAGLSASLK